MRAVDRLLVSLADTPKTVPDLSKDTEISRTSVETALAQWSREGFVRLDVGSMRWQLTDDGSEHVERLPETAARLEEQRQLRRSAAMQMAEAERKEMAARKQAASQRMQSQEPREEIRRPQTSAATRSAHRPTKGKGKSE